MIVHPALSDPTRTCTHDEETNPLLLGETAAWWAVTDVAEPVLVVVAPPTREILVTLDCEATFGPLKYGWITEPYDIGEGSSIEIPLRLPREVFQHELASDYVTDLLIRVDPVLLDGRPAIGLTLPALFVAWPEGPDVDPLVWSEAELEVYAPTGVLNPELSARLSEEGVTDRVLPPLWHLFPVEATVAEEEGRGVTVPVDDQSDEGVLP